MTRTEFVKAYAERSGLDPAYAEIGLLDIGSGHSRVALPCECGDEGCEGWAMVGIGNVLDHLQFSTPEPLRSAYAQTVTKSNEN